MSDRNLSAQAMFHKLALEHQPIHAFKSKNRRDFLVWKRATRPKALGTLGISLKRRRSTRGFWRRNGRGRIFALCNWLCAIGLTGG